MFLLDALDKTVTFNGHTYTLRLQFDVVLACFEILADSNMEKYQKVTTSLYLLIEEEVNLPIVEQAELYTHILDTYISPKKQTETDVPDLDILGNPMPVAQSRSKGKQLYDFGVDAERIYASFMETYQIDLLEERGKLRWEKFQVLLLNLPSDSSFMKVVEIRAAELPPSGEERKRLKELKARYSLPERR